MFILMVLGHVLSASRCSTNVNAHINNHRGWWSSGKECSPKWFGMWRSQIRIAQWKAPGIKSHNLHSGPASALVGLG